MYPPCGDTVVEILAENDKDKYVSYMMRTMTAGGLAMQGSTALVGMVLTWFSRNIPILAEHGFIKDRKVHTVGITSSVDWKCFAPLESVCARSLNAFNSADAEI